MIYALGPATLERGRRSRARTIDGVEHVIWREADEVVVAERAGASCASRRATSVARPARTALAR